MLLTPVTPKLNLELPEPKHTPLPFHLARTEMGRRGVWAQKHVHLNYSLYHHDGAFEHFRYFTTSHCQPFSKASLTVLHFCMNFPYCSCLPLVSIYFFISRLFECKHRVTVTKLKVDLVFAWKDCTTQVSSLRLQMFILYKINGNQWLPWKHTLKNPPPKK